MLEVPTPLLSNTSGSGLRSHPACGLLGWHCPACVLLLRQCTFIDERSPIATNSLQFTEFPLCVALSIITILPLHFQGRTEWWRVRTHEQTKRSVIRVPVAMFSLISTHTGSIPPHPKREMRASGNGSIIWIIVGFLNHFFEWQTHDVEWNPLDNLWDLFLGSMFGSILGNIISK